MFNLPTIGKYLRARLDGVGARGKRDPVERDPVCLIRASAVALTFASFFCPAGPLRMSHPKRTLIIFCGRFSVLHSMKNAGREGVKSLDRDASLIPRRVGNVDQSTEPC